MNPNARLIMLGADSETRGSIAAVVDAYREHGLFRRWPIDYLPTHGDGGAARNAALALGALRRFGVLLAQQRRAQRWMWTSACRWRASSAAKRRKAPSVSAALRAALPSPCVGR